MPFQMLTAFEFLRSILSSKWSTKTFSKNLFEALQVTELERRSYFQRISSSSLRQEITILLHFLCLELDIVQLLNSYYVT